MRKNHGVPVKFLYLALQVLDPTVVTHLQSLLVPPASLVMPWLTSAFVGFLPVAEVLLLWDRVVGLDSLLPLPLLAVAVLCFRYSAGQDLTYWARF